MIFIRRMTKIMIEIIRIMKLEMMMEMEMMMVMILEIINFFKLHRRFLYNFCSLFMFYFNF